MSPPTTSPAWRPSSLKSQTQSELPSAHLRQRGEAGDPAGGRTVHLAIRLPEIYMVEGVEQLRPELRRDPLRKLKALRQRGVRIEVIRAEEGISCDVPECSRGGPAPGSACAAVRVQFRRRSRS